MRFKLQLMFVLIVMLSVGLANAQGDEPSDEVKSAEIAKSNWQTYRDCLDWTGGYHSFQEALGFREDWAVNLITEDPFSYLFLTYASAICEVYIEHYQYGVETIAGIANVMTLSALDALGSVYDSAEGMRTGKHQ